MKLPHESAHTHVTGQSEYIDDRPFLHGEVYVGLIYSPHAHAEIKKIDTKRALNLPGVFGIFSAKDIPHNLWGTIFQDQPLLAENQVQYAGEVILVIAAKDLKIIQEAKHKIKIEYKKLNSILSIDEAKTKQSFIGFKRKIERGNVDEVFSSKNYFQIKDKIKIKGADHFYLESQAVIAYPKEDGQLEVHSSTQHPTEVQHVIAHGLGIPSKDVTCIVKRMGGGFGGKESQASPFAFYAALVAHKLKKPARLILTKDDDMIMTGKRNPFENEYRVAFDREGNILALDVELYSDGGAYADLSTAIMERAMLHCDNAYFIPHMRITGQVCKTNFHPHTAFRGFGGPKGVATVEMVIEKIAHHLKIDALEIRKRNCYRDDRTNNTTHYNQIVENNCLPQLFSQLEKDCDYYTRRKEIFQENKKNKNFVRGLSLTAVKFGISFTTKFLNQGNALLIIHRDGTIQLSTGATEMGQGVHARIAQLVAEEFGLSRDQIRTMPTTTDKNANTSPTAASAGTDLNGSAAVLACQKIKKRLACFVEQLFLQEKNKWPSKTAPLGSEPEIELHQEECQANKKIKFENGLIFDVKNPTQKISFQDLVNEAYLSRISLSEYAHYRVKDLHFNKLTGKGDAFLYFTQGTACSEVSINRYTGEVKVLRSDILMDLGRPINEALDLGQVYGAFVQGMGWMTTENLFYNQEGMLLSHSPSTYKIPNVQDIPREFSVKLIPNEGNIKNIRGTKAVGEPPLLLAISVWTAIQNALSYLPDYEEKFPNLPIPATQEEVLRKIYPEEFMKFEMK